MLKLIKDCILVMLGTFIMAIAVKFFILPFNVLSGGVAGIAVAIEPVFHLNPDLVINCLVLGMFLLGIVCLGKEFAVKTALSSLVYPVYLAVLTPFVPSVELDPFLASVYGGAIAGVGIGIVVRTGSSTGGMDIPPLILKKYFNFEVSKSIMVIDAMTVLLGFTTHGLESVLIGLFSVLSCSFCIDKVLMMGSQDCKSVQVISDNYQDLMNKIHHDLDRGSTLLEGQGGYTGTPRKVLLVVIENKEYNHLIRLVHEIDPNAFVITTDIKSVHGEGFVLDYKI